MQKLAKGKFVVSQKGKGGGFRLIKSSNDISLGELIELFENQRFLSDCLIGLEKECKNCYCPIYSNWSLIKKEIYEVYLSDIHKRLTHNDNWLPVEWCKINWEKFK